MPVTAAGWHLHTQRPSGGEAGLLGMHLPARNGLHWSSCLRPNISSKRLGQVPQAFCMVGWCIICVGQTFLSGLTVRRAAWRLVRQVRWSKYATVAAHVAMGTILAARAKATDLSSSQSIYSCYMFVWKLFYAGEFAFVSFRQQI